MFFTAARFGHGSPGVYHSLAPFPTRVAARCCQVLAFCRAPPFTPGKPSSCNHPIHPQPAQVRMKDQKPNKPKKPKSQKPFATEPPMPWIMAAIVQLPYPAIAQSRAVGKAERLIVSHARELPRLPLPSPLSGTSSTSVTFGSRAANQASWRPVGAPDR